MMVPFLSAALLLLLLLLTLSTTSATTIGVTYDPTILNLPSPEQVTFIIRLHRISAVRLLHPTPSAVKAFSGTEISLLLSLPNSIIPSFAANCSVPTLWLNSHVIPFYPLTRISLISVGSDPLSVSATNNLLPALRNLHSALIDLGISTIPVSTTFSTTSIVTAPFPPSLSKFQEPVESLVIRPLLQFLKETNSSFLINLYTYDFFSMGQLELGFALFSDHPSSIRYDFVTKNNYQNAFDMMVDGVIVSLERVGHGDIPVIVAETGWPCHDILGDGSGYYADRYLKKLVAHLRSGLGTALREEALAEAYIYQIFDGHGPNCTRNLSSISGGVNHDCGAMSTNRSISMSISPLVQESTLHVFD